MRWIWLLLLTSCTLGPDFCKPDVELPQNWDGEEVSCLFWENFEDPILSSLVAECLSSSYDAQIAEVRLCRARFERKKALSHIWPKIGLNYDMAHFDKSADFPILTSTDGFNIFEVGFDANWEFTLFGGLKRLNEAADTITEMQEARSCATQLTLVAEVVRNYFDLRHAQAQKVLTEKTLLLQTCLIEAADLQRIEELESSQPTLILAQEINQTENRLIALKSEIQLIQNRIAYLVNGLPGSLDERLSTFDGLPHQPSKPSCGLPSELLCRRPDIRLAEQQLAYRTAHVGLSIIDFLPSFDLLAVPGFLSTFFPRMFRAASYYGIYNLLAQVPLFQGGKLLASLRIAEANQQEALLDYTKAVLGALHEVDAACVLYIEKEKELLNLERSRSHAERLVYNYTLMQNEELVSKETVKKELLKEIQSESDYLKGRAALLQQTLALYKALGGGWSLN